MLSNAVRKFSSPGALDANLAVSCEKEELRILLILLSHMSSSFSSCLRAAKAKVVDLRSSKFAHTLSRTNERFCASPLPPIRPFPGKSPGRGWMKNKL